MFFSIRDRDHRCGIIISSGTTRLARHRGRTVYSFSARRKSSLKGTKIKY
jgi:hypothetical protein